MTVSKKEEAEEDGMLKIKTSEHSSWVSKAHCFIQKKQINMMYFESCPQKIK